MSTDAGTGLPDPETGPDGPRFPTARLLGEGYDAAEVDEFVAELQQALRRDPPAMAPYEVADQRFAVSRFGRRYRLREVDDYLDEGKQRLRERHGDDAVANLEGRAPEPHHVRTWWIYAVALVLAALMVVFVLLQL